MAKTPKTAVKRVQLAEDVGNLPENGQDTAKQAIALFGKIKSQIESFSGLTDADTLDQSLQAFRSLIQKLDADPKKSDELLGLLHAYRGQIANMINAMLPVMPLKITPAKPTPAEAPIVVVAKPKNLAKENAAGFFSVAPAEPQPSSPGNATAASASPPKSK
ncbi:MAG: hypothetical protein QM752_00025 [Gammaproteobacteria bacterium]